MNLLFFIPRRAASRFIICTNTSSLPPTASASAMQASLPDCTTMPRISSSTVTGRRGSMNMREPDAFQARGETFTCCSSDSFFSRNAMKTTYAVISLVSEAGSKRSSDFCDASSWPLDRSPTIQALPITAGGCGAAACTASETQTRRRARRRMGSRKGADYKPALRPVTMLSSSTVASPAWM